MCGSLSRFAQATTPRKKVDRMDGVSQTGGISLSENNGRTLLQVWVRCEAQTEPTLPNPVTNAQLNAKWCTHRGLLHVLCVVGGPPPLLHRKRGNTNCTRQLPKFSPLSGSNAKFAPLCTKKFIDLHKTRNLCFVRIGFFALPHTHKKTHATFADGQLFNDDRAGSSTNQVLSNRGL